LKLPQRESERSFDLIGKALQHLQRVPSKWSSAVEGASSLSAITTMVSQLGRLYKIYYILFRHGASGILGQWFATKMEPPVKPSFKMKTMRNIKPGTSPSLVDAFDRFLTSQDEMRDYLRTNADLDLAGIRFPNSLVRGIRFSMATGLHIITAHERRHMWQA
jgi:hypothetical protein